MTVNELKSELLKDCIDKFISKLNIGIFTVTQKYEVPVVEHVNHNSYDFLIIDYFDLIK